MIRKLLKFNWIIFAAMIALITIGTVAIWSAGNARAEAIFHDMWINNLVTALLGLVIYFALAFTDYRKILDLVALPAYIAAIVMLIAVLIFGLTVDGGKRWLWFFQPSEISKVCIIMFIAWLFGGDYERPRTSFKWFAIAFAIIAVPSVLILVEPDLGTALTLVPASVIMLLVARVWRRGLLTLTITGAIVAFAILGAVYEAEKSGVDADRRAKILRMVPLKPHQIDRVKVYLFPDEDVLNSGYNLRQAKISIGSGGLTGKGIGKGETNHLKYLPQSISMNDFIFCVWAEEMGYIGSLVLLALFGAIVVPGCWVAFTCTDGRGRLIALGVSSIVFAHVYINIAMSIGLLPITGLPLPFISSGRTFLITVMTGLGLIQSVSVHREENKR